MTRDLSYAAVMGRRNAIMQASLGLDYEEFITSPIAFVIPETLAQVRGRRQDMDGLRVRYVKSALKVLPLDQWTPSEVAFVAEDLQMTTSWVEETAQKLSRER
jgi:hypothetical protein